ncbi:MAG: zinc ribbon domain-containing protein [Chloroflexota bacterium]
MPIYEYVCPSCEARFEKLAPMGDGHQVNCSTCGTKSRRVISVFAAFTAGPGGQMSAVAGGCACGGCAGGSCAGCGASQMA